VNISEGRKEGRKGKRAVKMSSKREERQVIQ
jgi:hypothetical protein